MLYTILIQNKKVLDVPYAIAVVPMLHLYVVAHFIRATHLFHILNFTSITSIINDAGKTAKKQKLKEKWHQKASKEKPTGNDDEKFLAFGYNKKSSSSIAIELHHKCIILFVCASIHLKNVEQFK